MFHKPRIMPAIAVAILIGLFGWTGYTATANAGDNWCPIGSYPSGSTCQYVYHWHSFDLSIVPGDGNSTIASTASETTYLHVGDAMYWVAYRYYINTDGSFLSWTRCQLAACTIGAPYHIAAAGTTTYNRYSNNSVRVGIVGYMPYNSTFCYWVVTVGGTDVNMGLTNFETYGCGPYS